MTRQQLHVFLNLHRVSAWPYVLNNRARPVRYALDGRDCTAQINALVVAGCVRRRPDAAQPCLNCDAPPV